MVNHQHFMINQKIDLFNYCIFCIKQHVTIKMKHNTTVTIDLSFIFDENGYKWKQFENYKYRKQRLNDPQAEIKNIILIQSINSPIKIDEYFLDDSENIISVDTSKLVNVTAIDNFFFANCRNLQMFDTSGLTTITTIGNNFLTNCHNLVNFDATKLTSLISVGDYFLCGCENITIFDTLELTSLTTVGGCFLCNLHNLTMFDTKGLTSLTTVGTYFLGNLYNLTMFDARGLTSLTTIDNYFLCDCNNNAIITVKNPPDCLTEFLSKTHYKIVQLCDKPCIYLVNDCVI